MKATKFIVLAGAVLGLIALFLPVSKTKSALFGEAEYSAFQLLKGDKASDIVSMKNEALDKELREVEVGDSDASRTLQKAMDDAKTGVIIVWSPIFVLLILAVIGVATGKYGRALGITGLVFALICTLFGMIMMGAGEGDTQPGPAVYLVFAAGIVCVVGSVMTIVKPDVGGRFA